MFFIIVSLFFYTDNFYFSFVLSLNPFPLRYIIVKHSYIKKIFNFISFQHLFFDMYFGHMVQGKDLSSSESLVITPVPFV